MTYEIYQLRDDEAAVQLRFLSLAYADKHGGVKFGNYIKVYSGEIRSCQRYDALEALYKQFNCNRPRDFTGHSLSVSDVVVLDGEAYYCDSFGWPGIEFKEVR